MTSRRRYLRRTDGQALVEMALVAPFLLLVVFAIISFGLYINAVTTVQQAVRIGTRAAAIGDPLGCPGDSANAQEQAGNPPTVYGIVDDQINSDTPWMSAGSGSSAKDLISFAAVIGDQTNPQQNEVMVTVVYRYNPLIPIPGLLPSSVMIHATYQMLVEVPPTTGPTMPAGETTAWTSPAPPTTNVQYLQPPPGGC